MSACFERMYGRDEPNLAVDCFELDKLAILVQQGLPKKMSISNPSLAATDSTKKTKGISIDQ